MILDEIAEKTRERIAEEKRRLPTGEMRRMAEELASKELASKELASKELASSKPVSKGMASGKLASNAEGGVCFCFPFEAALRADGLSFICEVKKASPSKGLIAGEFPYLDIAREYEDAGASAISVLTEPYYFQGSDRYLQEIAQAAAIPVLRKDFTVDSYMIDQAKVLGASAVLLICAILDDGELREYMAQAKALGLSALVEAHDAQETERALKAGASIIGVNNRDLRTFQVDVNNSVRLRSLVPDHVVFVSESGIQGPEDTRKLYDNGTDAVLIGETLMRSADKRAALARLRAGR